MCLTTVCRNLLSTRIPLGCLPVVSHRVICLVKQCSNVSMNRSDGENEAAHRIMENIAAYGETVRRNPIYDGMPKKLHVESRGIYKLFHEVTAENLTKNKKLELDSPMFSGLVRSLIKKLSSASFEEIVHTLYCLCFWPFMSSAQTPNYKILWHMLDRECSARLVQWLVPQKLIIADYWFHLRLSRVTKYNFSMIKELIQKQERLSSSQLIQLMFCISIQRNVPQTLLNCLETKLDKLVSEVSLKELSIICLGYFKTENEINNLNLLKGILDHVAVNMAELEPVHMVAVLKCARKSFKPHYIAYYVKFLQKCALNCHKWDLYASVQSALLSSSAFVFEPLLLENAIEKFCEGIPKSRLKDVCKILQCLSLFNYLPNSKFTSLVLQEFLNKRELEIQSFPRDLAYLAVFYSYMGYYNHELLCRVLSSETVNKLPDYEKHCFAQLDYSIEIECEDYKGPRLSKSLRSRFAAKKRDDDVNSRMNGMAMKGIQSVMEILHSLDGFNQNTCIWHVLPHFVTPDIVIRLAPKVDAMPLVDYLKDQPAYEILKPPPEESWACLVFSSVHSSAYNSKRQVGIIVMKQRQLKKLGYKVLLLNPRSIPVDLIHREVLIKTKLNELAGSSLLLEAQ